MQVELVAPDRYVWSGEATMVVAKTSEGDLGILPGHTPLLGVLVNGRVEVHPVDGAPVVVAVLGGFLSVAGDKVSLLAEAAELADEISTAEAEQELRAAEGEGDAEAAARARARLAAASGGR
jgi:F-type H+-transporting ATPase subunit epsilon